MKISEVKLVYVNRSKEKIKINSSTTLYDLLLENWDKQLLELQEEFKVVYLNRNNMVLAIYPFSKGGVSQSVVDPKLIFATALKVNASGLILAHNHPSGNLQPSSSDIKTTKKIVKAGELLDIVVLDHIIITKESYFSFADENML